MAPRGGGAAGGPWLGFLGGSCWPQTLQGVEVAPGPWPLGSERGDDGVN